MIPYLWAATGFQIYFGGYEVDWTKILNKGMIKKLLLAAFLGDCMSLCAVYSGTYTIMTHTFVFKNLGGSIIVIYSLLTGALVHKYEILGSVIAFGGCLITVFDVQAKKVDASQQNILLGDIIACFGSVFTALYYSFNKYIVNQMPPLLAISVVMTISWIMLQIFGFLFVSNFNISDDSLTGSFGFFHGDWTWYVIIMVGLLGGAA